MTDRRRQSRLVDLGMAKAALFVLKSTNSNSWLEEYRQRAIDAVELFISQIEEQPIDDN